MTTTPLSGRRVLIIGGTDGIGRHTAVGLARRGAHVTVVGRDPTRGRAAVADIVGQTGNPRVEFVAADLSAQASIRELAARIGTEPLDVLINNIGGLYVERWETADGIEASLAVNALNPHLLTTLLRPALGAAPAARVVHVTGGMPGKIDLTDLQSTRYTPMTAYSRTKSVMMALAHDQAARWRDSGITVNVAYPGAASTPMTRGMTPTAFPGALRVLWPVFKPMMARAKPERAARSSIFLASDPSVAAVTGTYYDSNSRPTTWPGDVRDAAIRRRVRVLAERLTGLDGPGGPDAGPTAVGRPTAGSSGSAPTGEAS